MLEVDSIRVMSLLILSSSRPAVSVVRRWPKIAFDCHLMGVRRASITEVRRARFVR
jgi:hypothetical protein